MNQSTSAAPQALNKLGRIIMKIFGIEIKWPETKKSKVKRMLRENGSLATIKYILERGDICDDYCPKGYCNKYVKIKCPNSEFSTGCVKYYISNLIREGYFDLDLYRLYKIQGQLALRQKLLLTHKLNFIQLGRYQNMVKAYSIEQGNSDDE